MDLVPLREVFEAVIEARRAFPEGQEAFKQLVETFVTDPIKERRERRRLDRVAELADEKIGDREKEENLEEIMTSTEVQPLIEAIQEDDRRELQEIWANMLAKFATGKSQGFRRDFVLTLKNLEPIDVKCLELLPSILSNGYVEKSIIISELHERLGIEKDELFISLDVLKEKKCLIVKDQPNRQDVFWTFSSYGKILTKIASPLI